MVERRPAATVADAAPLATSPHTAIAQAPRSRVMFVVVAAASALFLVVAAAGALYLVWASGAFSSQSATPPDVSSPAPNAPVPVARVELLRCRAEVEASTDCTGPGFKLRVTPRWNGYVYLVAPGKNDAPTTFLTAQPNALWDVTSNRAGAGTDFEFPGGAKVLCVEPSSPTSKWTVVYSLGPVADPAFLAMPAGRKLSGAEQAELDALRRRSREDFHPEVSTAANGETVVSVASEPAAGQPILIDVPVPVPLP
jgi:hypothetical protein